MLTVLEGNSFLVADDHGDVVERLGGALLQRHPLPVAVAAAAERRAAAAAQLRHRRLLLGGRVPAEPAHAGAAGRGGVADPRPVRGRGRHAEHAARREPPARAAGAGAASCEFDFDFLDLFEVKAREYREEDLVFTDRTQPRIGVAERRDEPRELVVVRAAGRRASGPRRWSGCRSAATPSRPAITPPHHARRRARAGTTRANVVLLHGHDRRLPRYTSFYFGQERVRVAESLRAFRLHAPELSTDWEDLRNTYHRSLADLAALRMRPRHGDVTAARPAGRRAALVHDRVRPRHADHELPDAAAGAVAGGGDAGGAGLAAGRTSASTSATPSRARSCTSCGWAGWPPRAAPSPTTAASTPPCCS